MLQNQLLSFGPQTFIIPIILCLKILETHCTNMPCFFARHLIYKIYISVLSFLFYEGRFLDLNVLVVDFCSINGFCWHMVLNCSPVNLLLVHLILEFFEDSLLNCGDR